MIKGNQLMMFKKIVCLLCSSVIIFSGCATSSKDVTTAYVSPLQYKDYNCDQITAEMTRLNVRVTQLGGRLDEAASNDKALVGVGMVLFWPSLFFLGGTKNQEAEFARIKGEYEAINQAAVQRDCKITSEMIMPTPQDKSKSTKK
jgi:hypothetical protein